jgi:hypothetical protein
LLEPLKGPEIFHDAIFFNIAPFRQSGAALSWVVLFWPH